MGRTGFSTIIPSLALRSDNIALDRLLSPGRCYPHPDKLRRDATFDRGEMRAILSS